MSLHAIWPWGAKVGRVSLSAVPSRWLDVERLGGDEGVALVVAIGALTFVLALGGALALATMVDTRIVGNYRQSSEVFHAADAAIDRALSELRSAPDWNVLLTGQQGSTFVDGPPGVRTLADGTAVDLVEATQMARCGRASCSEADLVATTASHPWGANNPRWQIYSHGFVRDLLPAGAIDSRVYIVVWIADDPSENDGDPLRDGTTPDNPGRGVLMALAHAYGPRGARRGVEVTFSREEQGLRLLSWREVR